MTNRLKALTGIGFALALMLPLCGRAEQVALSDPLTSWPLNLGPQSKLIQLKDGAVHILAPKGRSTGVQYQGFSFTNMDASIKVSRESPAGQDAGLMFWATGPNDFYYFDVSDTVGSFSVLRQQTANGGNWSEVVPPTASPLVKTGVNAVNVLRVVTQGNSVTLFVNGQQLGTLNALAPAGGGTVGIWAENSAAATDTSDYAFSDLTVSQ